MMAAPPPPSASHFESELGLMGTRTRILRDQDDSSRASDSTRGYGGDLDPAGMRMESSSTEKGPSGRETTLVLPEPSTTVAATSTRTSTSDPSPPVASLKAPPPTVPLPMQQQHERENNAFPKSKMTPTSLRPILVPANVRRTSPNDSSPRLSVTFALLPPGKGIIPDLDHDSDDDGDMDRKPPARQVQVQVQEPQPDTAALSSENSTGDALPPAKPAAAAAAGAGGGARGIRGRRNVQDRDARRQQIRERTGLGTSPPPPSRVARATVTNSPVPTLSLTNSNEASSILTTSDHSSSEPFVVAAACARLQHAAALPLAPGTFPETPGTIPHAHTLPGDNMPTAVAAAAVATATLAPGDNLAIMPPTQRPMTRGRLVKPQQNPTADAYEAATESAAAHADDSEHSLKQRLRRENQNLPSSIRPGAYKEIPGRGLVRNETLRFSILTTLQKQRQSLRKMFSGGGSRRQAFANDGHSGEESSRKDIHHENLGHPHMSAPSRRQLLHSGNGATTNENMSSFRSVKSIPSVLVEEDEHDKRTYLGNISMRSLQAKDREGLCVARPVFHKEASTLDALCIIPGDWAVTAALDEQLRVAQKADSAYRLEQLSSGRPPLVRDTEFRTTAQGEKRVKVRRVAQFAKKLVQQPQKILKSKPILKTAKHLIPFRKRKASSTKKEPVHERTMRDLRSARGRLSDTSNVMIGAAVRRNSW